MVLLIPVLVCFEGVRKTEHVRSVCFCGVGETKYVY
jgi:hypothetical protein